MESQPISRAERRRRTEARILAAARTLFAETGYDRTSIRAVAAAAGADPGLVMRYFGSKDQLFARSAEFEPGEQVAGTPDEVAEQLLAALEQKVAEEPTEALAMLRSMFTHPDATGEIRAAMLVQQRQAARHLAEEDAELRAGLLGALTIGVVVGRHLLGLDGLADAPPERVSALLRAAFHDIAHGEPRQAE